MMAAGGSEKEEEEVMATIRLQSSDGKTFAVPLNVVRVSRTVDTMIKGKV